MTPAAGRLIDLESSPQRQLRRLGGDDLLGRVAVKVDHEDQPTLGEVRLAQALVDRVRVAQRPPGLPSRVELAHLLRAEQQQRGVAQPDGGAQVDAVYQLEHGPSAAGAFRGRGARRAARGSRPL